MVEKQPQLICVSEFTVAAHTSYCYIMGMRVLLSIVAISLVLHQPSTLS